MGLQIELHQVKTLNEWFANLPLIDKLGFYNSHLQMIERNLSNQMYDREKDNI